MEIYKHNVKSVYIYRDSMGTNSRDFSYLLKDVSDWLKENNVNVKDINWGYDQENMNLWISIYYLDKGEK